MGTTHSFNGIATSEDRVRAHTPPEINRQIDVGLERRLRFYAVQDKQAITERLEELDREWDIERAIVTNAGAITLASMLFGATRSRLWFLLPVAVGGFLLQHAIQGWCPPVSIFRRRGMRTRIEIEQERYALKLLRGDFDNVARKKGEKGEPRDAGQLVQDLRQGVPT
jgi:hypothetical protein